LVVFFILKGFKSGGCEKLDWLVVSRVINYATKMLETQNPRSDYAAKV
jgi:hypothetical protein